MRSEYEGSEPGSDKEILEETKRQLDIFRERTPEEVRETIERIGDGLKSNLYRYMLRPESDPEVLNLVDEFGRELSTGVGYGHPEERLPRPMLPRLKDALYGSTEVMRTIPLEHRPFSPESADDLNKARRFVEMTRKAFGGKV